jgi:hypothetical protein
MPFSNDASKQLKYLGFVKACEPMRSSVKRTPGRCDVGIVICSVQLCKHVNLLVQLSASAHAAV